MTDEIHRIRGLPVVNVLRTVGKQGVALHKEASVVPFSPSTG